MKKSTKLLIIGVIAIPLLYYIGKLDKEKTQAKANSSATATTDTAALINETVNMTGPQKASKAMNYMLTGNSEKSIFLYEKLLADNPTADNKWNYENQLGVNHFMLEKYDKALEYYKQAHKDGMSESMSDDNVWEVCEKQFSILKDKKYLQEYLTEFPKGKKAQSANDMLK